MPKQVLNSLRLLKSFLETLQNQAPHIYSESKLTHGKFALSYIHSQYNQYAKSLNSQFTLPQHITDQLDSIIHHLRGAALEAHQSFLSDQDYKRTLTANPPTIWEQRSTSATTCITGTIETAIEQLQSEVLASISRTERDLKVSSKTVEPTSPITMRARIPGTMFSVRCEIDPVIDERRSGAVIASMPDAP